MTINQNVTFDQIKAARMAVKAERAQAHMQLLNSRYDLSKKTVPEILMSGGKAIPVGPTARIQGATWEQLFSQTTIPTDQVASGAVSPLHLIRGGPTGQPAFQDIARSIADRYIHLVSFKRVVYQDSYLLPGFARIAAQINALHIRTVPAVFVKKRVERDGNHYKGSFRAGSARPELGNNHNTLQPLPFPTCKTWAPPPTSSPQLG